MSVWRVAGYVALFAVITFAGGVFVSTQLDGNGSFADCLRFAAGFNVLLVGGYGAVRLTLAMVKFIFEDTDAIGGAIFFGLLGLALWGILVVYAAMLFGSGVVRLPT